MYSGIIVTAMGHHEHQMLHLLIGTPTVPTTAVHKSPSGDARQWKKLSVDKNQKQKQNKGSETRCSYRVEEGVVNFNFLFHFKE